LKNSKLKKVILSVITFTLLTGGFMTYKNFNKPNVVTSIQANYLMPDTLNDLIANSNYVVIGEVQNKGNTFKVNMANYVVDSNNKPADRAALYVKHTVSNISITQSLKGDLEKGNIIEVMQEEFDNIKHDKSLSKKVYSKGDKYIFFLNKFTPKSELEIKDYKTVKYLPINPYQGEIQITGDKIDIIKEEFPMFKNGDAVQDVVTQIQESLK